MLPDIVAIKFDVYTLACHEFSKRMPAISDATEGDTRVDPTLCVERFDSALADFLLHTKPKGKTDAADLLANGIGVWGKYFRNLNDGIAQEFDDLAELMYDTVDDWNGIQHLQDIHLLGQTLAKGFFAKSQAHSPSKQRSLMCSLELEFDGRARAPVAYCSRNWAGSDATERRDCVVMRFNYDADFTNYLSYPYFFLHEYTAHIYANDYGNELFNDGWMLYAADRYLRTEINARRRKPLPHPGLNLEQAWAFSEHLSPRLSGIPQIGCNLARRIDALLGEGQRSRFMRITHELAAFQPGTDSSTWPSQVINSLRHEYQTDRKGLLEKFENTTTVFELMEELKRV